MIKTFKSEKTALRRYRWLWGSNVFAKEIGKVKSPAEHAGKRVVFIFQMGRFETSAKRSAHVLVA